MKKVNFHTLQTLPTPDSWIESALSIPSREEKPVAVLRRPRRMIAAAASIVLVSAVGIAAWFLFGRTPAPIVAAPLGTVATEYAEPTMSALVPSTEFPPATAPSDAPTNEPTNASTNAPADTNADAPTDTSTEPTGVPAPSAPAPTEAATSVPQSVSTEPPAPTEKPQSAPTEPPAPTQKPVNPTQPPSPPTESSWYYEDEVIADIRSADFPENGRVYCGIYDSDGKLFGDQNPYSEQHLATVLRYEERRDIYLVVYRQSEKGILPHPGYYTYQFYDEEGNVFYTDERPLQ